MQWPFKYVYKCTDSVFDGSATLNSRRTSIQTVQTIWTFFSDWKLNSMEMHVVSSVLSNGPQINNPISRCKETWAGDGWRAWGGGVDGDPRPTLAFQWKDRCSVLIKRA